MAYERDKDMLLKECGSFTIDDYEYELTTRSYDFGDPKLTLVRRFTKKDGKKGSSGVFRLREDELDGLLELLEDVDPFDFSHLAGDGED